LISGIVGDWEGDDFVVGVGVDGEETVGGRVEEAGLEYVGVLTGEAEKQFVVDGTGDGVQGFGRPGVDDGFAIQFFYLETVIG